MTTKGTAMKTFQITQKNDYYITIVIVHARTEQAAINKSKRIWPCRQYISIKAA